MGLVARDMERAGIVTVVLTQMPFVLRKVGAPRGVAVEFPFSMVWGRPGDREMHVRILRHMLEAAETSEEPGTIVELPYTWSEEDTRKRDWFPVEPPPWLASQEKIGEILDFIQNGDPMEEV